jgi:DNA recombination protein RmuC
MDTSVMIALVSGLLLGAVAVLAAWWLQPGRRRDGERAMAELAGRLSQMAESQAAQQSRLSEQLQAQERAVAKALEERLGDLAKKVGDRLQETSTRSQETLTDLRERLAVIDKAQQNITELSSQVVGLQDILANKQARGAFGEVQLRDIVESILPPSAYDFQVTLGNGRRADCLLKLPHPPGSIAIDSKFPLESFEALRRAEGEVQVRQARTTFSNDIRRHVRDIAERYILPDETAESALMFLPSEAVYAELHASFREVVEESYRNRVWIVSPTTLMATLNTVRAILKDVRMREQAGLIQREVGVLMVDVERLGKRVVNLETHFDHARRDIDQIKTSTGKILSRGERIIDLEIAVEQGEEEEEAIASEPIRPALPKI